ncbi:MAG: caspase family protein [Rhodopirellula sp.]|nr:caspase family protein [Rhodopirellula sp.]
MCRIMSILLTLVLTVGSAAAPCLAESSALHAILVADTTDAKIGHSTARDLSSMREEAAAIARNAGLEFEVTVIEGRQLSRDAVTTAVKAVQPGNDDVVLFYFAGHGFRTKTKNDRWPFLFTKNNQGLDQTWVYDRLREKGPRLLLVISDCCNSVTTAAVDSQVQRSDGLRRENFIRLFREASGTLQAAAASPGEYAWSSDDSGGMFTMQFLKALHTGLASEKVTWTSLMKAATQPMNAEGRQQTPLYAFLSTDADDGPKKPSALPSLPPPAPTGTTLSLKVSGTGQVVTLKVASGVRATGTIEVDGLGGKRDIRVGADQTVSLSVSGTGNVVQIPNALRKALKVKTSGIGNRVSYY